MAPVRSALVVAAAAVSGTCLHGCMDAITNAVHGYIDLICQSAVDGVVDQVEGKLIPDLQTKCQELRDQAFKISSDEEKADGVKAQCMDRGSVLLDKASGDQRQNYTTACVDSLKGMWNASQTGGASEGVDDFIASVNITGAYTDLVDGGWEDMFENLKEEHGLNGDDDESESSDAAADGKEAQSTEADDAAPEDKFSMTPVALPRAATPGFAAVFLVGAAFSGVVGFLGRRVVSNLRFPRSDEEQLLE